MDRAEIQSCSPSFSPRIPHPERGRTRFPGLNKGSLKHKTSTVRKTPSSPLTSRASILVEPMSRSAALDERAASGRGLFRSATARGRGGTDQGLSVLHEIRTFVEYTHLSASSTPPSCSTRRAPPEQPSTPLRRRDQSHPLSHKTSGDSHPRQPTSVSDVMASEALRSRRQHVGSDRHLLRERYVLGEKVRSRLRTLLAVRIPSVCSMNLGSHWPRTGRTARLGRNLMMKSQDLRSRTLHMRCSESLVSTRVARPRVGAMFSRRLTRLTLSQISPAPARATSSGISAKRRK